MTTSEQHAADVLAHYTHICGGAPYDPVFLGRLIADAVHAATLEERDACAGTIAAMGREFSEGARGHSNELRYAFDHFFVAIGLRVLHREEEWPSVKEALQAALEKARGQPTA